MCDRNNFYEACNEIDLHTITKFIKYGRISHSSCYEIEYIIKLGCPELIECLMTNGIPTYLLCFEAIRHNKLKVLKQIISKHDKIDLEIPIIMQAFENKQYEIIKFLINNKNVRPSINVLMREHGHDHNFTINLIGFLLSCGMHDENVIFTCDDLIVMYNNRYYEVVDKLIKTNSYTSKYQTNTRFNNLCQSIIKITKSMLTNSLVKHKFYYDLIIKIN